MLDQLSKVLIRRYIPQGESVIIIKNIFRITDIRNPGGAFGLFPKQQWLFLAISIAVIAGIIIFLLSRRPSNRLMQAALGMTAGGAVGNLIDRLIFGQVTDFLDFYFWPVFNLADSAIVIGMFLLVLLELKGKPQNGG